MSKTDLKKMLLILMVLILSFSGTACQKKVRNEKTNSTKPAQNLDFRITWKNYSGRGEAIQKIVDAYNAKNRSAYRINMTGGDEDIAALEDLLKKNSETIYVLPYRYVQYFGEQGYLADLSDRFASSESVFYPQIWKLGQVRGTTYGIPWLGHSICLIYNQQLLEQAGVDPKDIKDLASFHQSLEKIEAATEAKGVGLAGANHNDVSWMVNQFIYGFGSSLVDASGKSVSINNEKSKQALNYYKNELGPHAQPGWQDHTGVEVMACFRKQQIAFEFQGVWGVSDIEKNGDPFEVGVIPLENIGLPAEVGPMMLAVPKSMSAEKQAAAAEFIKYLISKEAQERIMDGEYSPEHDASYPFRTPVRKDLTDRLVFQKYPQYIPFVEGFKNPSIDVPVPKWQKIKDQYYAPGLHQVMKSEMSIDRFLAMIEREGNLILAEP